MKKLSQEEIQLIKDSGLFDPQWYAAQYPDVALSGLDPFEHYARFGALLRRNPSSYFDTKHYELYQDDVVAAGISPFLHYIQFGRAEKRAARHIQLSNKDINISLSIVHQHLIGSLICRIWLI